MQSVFTVMVNKDENKSYKDRSEYRMD